jgi:hypothetical protein
MSKNTFPLIAGKGAWAEFSGSYQTSKWCLLLSHRDRAPLGFLCVLPDTAPVSRTGEGSGPDWARTSDPALIKRML